MRSLLVLFALLVGLSSSYAAEQSDAVAEFYAGHAALQQGDPGAAITHFSKALDKGNLEDTQIAYVHHYRAIAYQRLDRHQEAIDDYTQALAIGTLPKRVQAAVYYNRAIALDHLSNYDRAIKDYSQAIALKPDYAEAFMNRGNAYRKLSDNDAALRDYESSAAYGNPIKHLPYYGQGLVLEAKGDRQGALKAFQTALLLDPGFQPAREKIESYQAAGLTTPVATGTTGATTVAAAAPTAPVKPASAKPTTAQTVQPPVGAPASSPTPTKPATSTMAGTTPAKPVAAKPATNANVSPALPVTSSSSPAVSGPAPSGQTGALAPPSKPASPPASAAASTSGAFLVQVGAFTSEDLANSQAQQISGKYSDLLSGLDKDIQRADLGSKGIYYRLRFGPFSTRNEATDRCAQLKSRGQDCIIVAGSAG